MNKDLKNHPWVILLGCMGSGKSSIGKSLAQKLNCPFTDLDSAIEESTEQTVPLIFEEQGEDAFREIESSALHTILFEREGILATGGGTPCFYDNMLLMKESGLTIYLEASPDVLVNRILSDKLNSRPLLEGLEEDELLKSISNLIEKRSPFYQQASLIVNAAAPIDELVDYIIKEI